MIYLESFKPVKHLNKFEFHYLQCLDILNSILHEDSSKLALIDSYKEKCVFEKKIFIYKKNDDEIGFCMYEVIDDIAYIILDYVDQRFKGCGRKCRELLISEFKNKAKELRLKIHTSNKLSLNSARKIIPAVSHFCSVKEEGVKDFSEYIEFVVEY